MRSIRKNLTIHLSFPIFAEKAGVSRSAPRGRPGCPLLAFSTMSTDRKRRVLCIADQVRRAWLPPDCEQGV